VIGSRAGATVVMVGLATVLSSCAVMKPSSVSSEKEVQQQVQPQVVEPVVEVIPAAAQPSTELMDDSVASTVVGNQAVNSDIQSEEKTDIKADAVAMPEMVAPAVKPDPVTKPSLVKPSVSIAPNTFLVTSGRKDASHLFYGVGSTLGFAVNGEQGKELVVARGETYTFKIDAGVKHDFYLSTSPKGWGASTLTKGVKGNFTYKGIVTFKPTADTPAVVYYQCRNHKNMGSKLHVVNKGAESKVVFGVKDKPRSSFSKSSAAKKTAAATGVKAEQKLKFAEMFIASSPASKRIEASDNTEAKQLLADARARLNEAKKVLSGGSNDKAITAVDEALRLMSVASQLVPSESQLAELRLHYDELLKGAETYEKSYRRNYKMMSKKGKKNLPELDVGQVSAMIADAKKLAENDHFADANKLLSNVQRSVTGALTQLLADETMDYTLSFDTPKEEYEYELSRYMSYEELLPLAIEQKQPSRQMRALMDQFANKGKDIFEMSGPTAKKGDYKTAIQMLQGATSHVQRALRVVGVR